MQTLYKIDLEMAYTRQWMLPLGKALKHMPLIITCRKQTNNQ